MFLRIIGLVNINGWGSRSFLGNFLDLCYSGLYGAKDSLKVLEYEYNIIIDV